jgi:hypothetical protein
MPSVFHKPVPEPRPPFRCEGTNGATGARGLGVGRAYANTEVYYEIIPVFGALRARIRAKVASANATLDFVHVGPDFDPEQMSKYATATLNPAGAENSIVYTAKEAGFAGTNISVTYVNGGNNQTLSVAVSGKAITVNLATNGGGTPTSTAAQVVAAIAASTAANNLVSCAYGSDGGIGDGSGVPVAVAQTFLFIAYSALGGTLYTSGNPSQLALTAGTEAKTDIDCYGEGYVLLKLTGSGTGTVTYIDVSQLPESL